MRKLLLASLVLAVMLSCSAAPADASYQIRELHMAPGTASLGCIGWINGTGGSRLAGTLYDSGASFAAVSDANGNMVLLGEGFANGVNSSGQTVGYSQGAVCWDTSGNLSRLELPSDTVFSQANAINDAGQIAGYCASGTTTVLDYIVLWNGANDPLILGEGCGKAINSGGSVAGYTRDSGGSHHAFVWTSNGGLRTLSGGTASEANALNDVGQAAGMICDANGGWASVWDVSGSFRLLPNLSGSIGSTAWAINNAGVVVGSCDTATGTYAVLWEADGTVVNLGQLPGHGSSIAYGLSDSGQVAGCSVDAMGMPHAVVWNPVPEPASVIALVVGLAGLLPRLRKR